MKNSNHDELRKQDETKSTGVVSAPSPTTGAPTPITTVVATPAPETTAAPSTKNHSYLTLTLEDLKARLFDKNEFKKVHTDMPADFNSKVEKSNWENKDIIVVYRAHNTYPFQYYNIAKKQYMSKAGKFNRITEKEAIIRIANNLRGHYPEIFKTHIEPISKFIVNHLARYGYNTHYSNSLGNYRESLAETAKRLNYPDLAKALEEKRTYTPEPPAPKTTVAAPAPAPTTTVVATPAPKTIVVAAPAPKTIVVAAPAPKTIVVAAPAPKTTFVAAPAPTKGHEYLRHVNALATIQTPISKTHSLSIIDDDISSIDSASSSNTRDSKSKSDNEDGLSILAETAVMQNPITAPTPITTVVAAPAPTPTTATAHSDTTITKVAKHHRYLTLTLAQLKTQDFDKKEFKNEYNKMQENFSSNVKGSEWDDTDIIVVYSARANDKLQYHNITKQQYMTQAGTFTTTTLSEAILRIANNLHGHYPEIFKTHIEPISEIIVKQIVMQGIIAGNYYTKLGNYRICLAETAKKLGYPKLAEALKEEEAYTPAAPTPTTRVVAEPAPVPIIDDENSSTVTSSPSETRGPKRKSYDEDSRATSTSEGNTRRRTGSFTDREDERRSKSEESEIER